MATKVIVRTHVDNNNNNNRKVVVIIVGIKTTRVGT
jgi:hypothetical protein